MKFNDAIDRLDKFSKVVNRAIIGVAIVEALFVLFIGIASSYLDTENETINKFSFWSLFVFGILYLLLLLLKTLYNANYPGSITNELKSERDLFVLKRNSDRQKTINDFLISTIQRLNGQTCALNYGDETHLCDQGIQEGIRELIHPIIENMHFMLDTTATDFTIGVYLNSYSSMEDFENWESGILIISDKLEKHNIIEKELLTNPDVKGEQFQIQTSIRQSFNDYKYIVHNYINGGMYTIICSPMPFACDEDDVSGVLFIISKHLESIPSETEINLMIFNRVISNWVYRYNECVLGRQDKIQSQIKENKDKGLAEAGH